MHLLSDDFEIFVRVPDEVEILLPRRRVLGPHGLVLLKIFEVLRVQLAIDPRLVRRAARVQPIPTNPAEECMCLDLGDAPRAEALIDVAEQTLNQISRLGAQGHLRWEAEVVAPVHDLPTRGHGLVAVEGRVPDQHLVHDGADAPPVTLEAVPFLEQHLGRDVVRGADGAVRQSAAVLVPVVKLCPARLLVGLRVFPRRSGGLLHDLRQGGEDLLVDGLAQAEIAELHVAVAIEKKVVGLDVAVDEIGGVHSLQRQNRLRDVKSRLVLGQGVAAHKKRHHVAAGKVLHHEVQKLVILKRVVQLDHRLVVHLRQEVPLRLDVVHLPAANHFRLLELLHGEDLAVGLVAHQSHLTEGAAADDGEGLEIISRELGALQPHELALLLLELREELGLLALWESLVLHHHAALHALSQALRLVLVQVLDVALGGVHSLLRLGGGGLVRGAGGAGGARARARRGGTAGHATQPTGSAGAAHRGGGVGGCLEPRIKSLVDLSRAKDVAPRETI